MRALFEFDHKPIYFEHPRGVIVCREASQLPAAFDDVEAALADGHHVAGYVSYEAGYALEPALMGLAAPDDERFPLMCLGVFDPPRRHRPRASAPAGVVANMHPSIPYDAYAQDIARIRAYIQEGDVYQVTYCFKQLFSFRGSAYGLYRSLLRHQPVPYPAFIETDDHTILSLSPEMFVRCEAGRVSVKPMKGSWPSGRLIDDLFGGIRLKFDAKNRAENVMIADLLRNDLGRVATGIRAPRLFEVARYRTIFQMTSTVTGRVPVRIGMQELFRAIFPSGSVTGAPKIRAMQVIRALERSPRRIYTGAIGWITPRREMFFNVPIRTLLIRGRDGEMGVGGGIVWDSTAPGEWAEGQWKSRFLAQAATQRIA